jgi:hypothetical protein
MSVLNLTKTKVAANGRVLVWNPSKRGGAGWTWLHLLNAKSDLRPWGGPRAPQAGASAATKRAHSTFLSQLIKRAQYLVLNGPSGESGADAEGGYLPAGSGRNIIDVESIARSIRIVSDSLTKTTIPPVGLWFPISPESYEVGNTYDWEEVDIIGLGRTVHSGIKGLPTIQVEATLPGEYDPSYCLGITSEDYFQSPAKWINYAEELAERMDVFRLVVGNRRSYEGSTEYSFNELMRITQITWGEIAGMPFDRRIRIEFSGYRKQSIQFAGGAYALSRELPKVHRVKKGEDYQDIAKRYYGDVSLWKYVADHNNDASSKRVRSWTSKTRKQAYEISFTKKSIKLPRPRS